MNFYFESELTQRLLNCILQNKQVSKDLVTLPVTFLIHSSNFWPSRNPHQKSFFNVCHTVRPDVCFQLRLQHQHDQQKILQWPPVTGIVFWLWRGAGPRFHRVHDANVPRQTKDSFYYWVTKQRLQQWLYKIKENIQLKGTGEKMQVSCWECVGIH